MLPAHSVSGFSAGASAALNHLKTWLEAQGLAERVPEPLPRLLVADDQGEEFARPRAASVY